MQYTIFDDSDPSLRCFHPYIPCFKMLYHQKNPYHSSEDGRGFISRESLTKLLGEGAAAEADELLQEVDPKATGRVRPDRLGWGIGTQAG